MALDAVAKPHQLIASDRVEGTAVRRPNGDMIGHIERLMIDKVSGQVSYAVMSSGGFLGMGARLLPLPWGRLRYSARFEAYELDLDEDELRRAPSFRADADFDWGDRSQEAELHRSTASRLIGAASEVCVPPARRRPRPPAQRRRAPRQSPIPGTRITPWSAPPRTRLKGMPEFSPRPRPAPAAASGR